MKKILVLATAVVSILFTGCTPVFVGDSVLWQSSAAIDQVFDDEHVDAVIGRGPESVGFGSTSLRQAIIDRLPLLTSGDTLVIQEAGDHVITDAFVQWVAAYVPDDICIAWITPHDHGDVDVLASVQAIRENITVQPCVRIIDWYSVDTTLLTTDELHLNEAGVEAFVDLIQEGLS